MARYRHPHTVGLPLDSWPESDRIAWQRAFETGDILNGSGPAAHWKPTSQLTVQRAYGNWLRFLKDRDRLTETKQIGARFTQLNLKQYIDVLRSRVSPVTVVGQLQHLSRSIRVMSPGTDRTLIKLAIGKLNATSRSVRNKATKLVSPTRLFEIGRTQMARWLERKAHDPRLNAMDYRDGLMIAFLALCPIRLANLAQMRIDRHLVLGTLEPRIHFEPTETKGGHPIDVAFPADLITDLDYYLDQVHPILATAPEWADALWPSLYKTPMKPASVYYRIKQITEAHLGYPLTPHMFRDAAATFISEMAPEQALMAASVLQHRSFRTTRKHYIHGQQHKACYHYQSAIEDLMRHSTE